jgi:hypothetical protein
VNKKTTAALLVALIALTIGYWVMLRLEERGKEKVIEAKRVFDFEPDQIYTAEVQRIDEPVVAASREQGKPWAMVKPNPTIEANQVIWNRLAITFAGLTNERTIEGKPSDLATYGLDKPVLTISVAKPDGSQARLAFGAIDATQSYRYALAEDGSVFLVAVKAFQELDRPLAYLRNPYIVTIGEQGITRIEYSRFWAAKNDAASPARTSSKTPEIGEESVVVAAEKDPEGNWRLVSPIQALANQEMVTELARQIQFGVGRGYIEEPKQLSDYGLEPPKARVTVFSGAGSEPQTLFFGSLEATETKQPGKKEEIGGIYAKNAARPAVFVIDANIGALLPKTPDAFRECRLLTHAATDIRSIHYKSAYADVVLENSPERGWQIAGAENNEGTQQAINNLVTFLKVVEGRGFPGDPQPQFGLDHPIIDITFTFSGNQPPASIRVGARVPDTEQSYATQDNGVVTLLNAIDVAALTKRPFDFTERAVMRFVKPDAIRLELTFEDTKYVFEKIRGQWRVKEPANRALGSPTDVAALVAVLSSAAAEDIELSETPQDLAPFGLDKPIAVITVATAKPDAPNGEVVHGPLTIGNTIQKDSQLRYAATAMHPGIFHVHQALVDEMRETLKGVR